MSLQAIKYARGSLELLDQRLLPHEFTYLPVRDVPTSFNHIKDMVVRGAPAIGVTGVLTIAVDLVANKGAGASFAGAQEALAYVQSTADYLVTRCVSGVICAIGRPPERWSNGGAWARGVRCRQRSRDCGAGGSSPTSEAPAACTQGQHADSALPWTPALPWSSRPTAVNLRDGLERVKAAAAAAAQAPGATAGAVVEAVVAAAEAYFDADIKTNKVLLLGAFANHRVDNLKQPQVAPVPPPARAPSEG